MTELKPCPFCGQMRQFIGTPADILGNDDTETLGVVCDYTRGGCGATAGFRSTRAEAIEAWNGRRTIKVRPRVVKRGGTSNG